MLPTTCWSHVCCHSQVNTQQTSTITGGFWSSIIDLTQGQESTGENICFSVIKAIATTKFNKLYIIQISIMFTQDYLEGGKLLSLKVEMTQKQGTELTTKNIYALKITEKYRYRKHKYGIRYWLFACYFKWNSTFIAF